MSRSALVSIVLALAAVPALADEPVEFDASRVFACRDFTPKDAVNPPRKLVVIVIPVSTNFGVKELTVETIRYELKLPKSVTVVDHLPKTRTGTNVVGTVHRKEEGHRQTEVNIKYTGEGKVGFNLWGAQFNVGGGASREDRDVKQDHTSIEFNHLPPQEQIVIAGSRDEGQTRYFDLNWSDQTTRAGQTDFAILAEVHKDWTGDCFVVRCTARQNGTIVGKMNKIRGLYLQGDEEARKRVENQAETMRAPATSEERAQITNSLGMRLRLIPSGSFLMGSPSDDQAAGKDEKPQHRVTITRPFYMGVCEVTQDEYKQVMKDNPSKFKDSDQQPVEYVSWLDAVKFCNALSRKESLKPFYKIDGDDVTVIDCNGEGYRLPTEAEWEYSCRGRTPTVTRYWFGDDVAQLGVHAWFGDNSKQSTHPVGGGGTENPLGLCDMHGNVWEWCWDWYGENFYSSPVAAVDPRGPDRASYRVFRGGSWNRDPPLLRSAYRSRDSPVHRNFLLGFRVARSSVGLRGAE